MAQAGGDEIGALVLDVGTAFTRAGYAGDDTPKALFRTSIGVREGDGVKAEPADAAAADAGAGVGAPDAATAMEVDAGADAKAAAAKAEAAAAQERRRKAQAKFVVGDGLSIRRDSMDVFSPMSDGLVQDENLFEAVLHHALYSQLHLDPSDHPVLLAEPSFNTRAIREMMTELLFEKFQLPALFISKAAVLASFASGRATSLVLDMGASGTSAVPVVEGYVLPQAVQRSGLGGNVLDRFAQHVIQDAGFSVEPRYMFARKETEAGSGRFTVTRTQYPKVRPSFVQFHIDSVIADFKETACRVSEDVYDRASLAHVPTIAYELPDGKTFDVGPDRFRIPEALFRPSLLQELPGGGADLAALDSLPRLVYGTCSGCDTDLRGDLYKSIVVSGGNSLFDGLPDRLYKELFSLVPDAYRNRLKLLASTSAPERKQAVWLGGSILASLGSLHQMWMSKKEYQEHGKSLVERRCP